VGAADSSDGVVCRLVDADKVVSVAKNIYKRFTIIGINSHSTALSSKVDVVTFRFFVGLYIELWKIGWAELDAIWHSGRVGRYNDVH